jgi:hypothetical protein
VAHQPLQHISNMFLRVEGSRERSHAPNQYMAILGMEQRNGLVTGGSEKGIGTFDMVVLVRCSCGIGEMINLRSMCIRGNVSSGAKPLGSHLVL